jgi:hypothetical protein
MGLIDRGHELVCMREGCVPLKMGQGTGFRMAEDLGVWSGCER